MTGIEVEFLDDGGQSAGAVAERLISFLAEARTTIDVAIYDFDARVGATARIADALEAAAGRGVAIRVVFNQEREAEATHNPPMICDPETIDGLEVPTKGVHDQGSLMHHKYAVRDGTDVWTGSTNWTDDAFTREENAIVRVSSPDVAASYARNFEQLWTKGRLESSGGEGTSVTLGRGVDVQPLFSPWPIPGTPDIRAHRSGPSSRADPLPGHHIGRGARHARRDRRTRIVRPDRRVRRDPDA